MSKRLSKMYNSKLFVVWVLRFKHTVSIYQYDIPNDNMSSIKKNPFQSKPIFRIFLFYFKIISPYIALFHSSMYTLF